MMLEQVLDDFEIEDKRLVCPRSGLPVNFMVDLTTNRVVHICGFHVRSTLYSYCDAESIPRSCLFENCRSWDEAQAVLENTEKV